MVKLLIWWFREGWKIKIWLCDIQHNAEEEAARALEEPRKFDGRETICNLLQSPMIAQRS